VQPLLTGRSEDGEWLPALVWRFDAPTMAVSTAVLGGGIGLRNWILNMTVPRSYDRDDPAAHLAEVAADLGLVGPGIGLMTAVDVTRRQVAADGGVLVAATVGIGAPTWAAAPAGADPLRPRPGTVNIVASVPGPLCHGALVNLVSTAVEARAQAMIEMGFPGTGTPSDAVCVTCPAEGDRWEYGGTRSYWGSRLARAVHKAVCGRTVIDR
jgi:adenosylcobinamide hydrolase